jgi:hypothetical protein
VNRLRTGKSRYSVSCKLSWLAIVTATAMLGGCSTSILITPQVAAPAAPECQVRGHLAYEGNRDYLPAVLIDDPGRPADSILRYAHEDHYGRDDLPTAVQLVNPLHLIGMPTGSGTLSIAARLDVMRGGVVVRAFGAVVTMERSESMFSEGATFTEMRRNGLMLLKNNISAQVCADQSVTQAILDAPTYAAKSP